MATGAALPNVAALSGPVLIGYILNFMLYGTLSVQVYMYYLAFPKDTPVAKALVSLLYAVETTQTILIIHDAFATYAKGFMNLEALNNVGLNWLSVPVMSGIVSCSVQLFFAYRIWVLSRSIFVVAIVVLIALTQCGAALAAGGQAFIIGNFADLQTEAFVSTSIWLAGSALCDVIIAAAMTYYLSTRTTGFRATNVLISRLIRMTVETGTITATVATLDVTLFLSFRHANYHTVPALILAKLYSNTCLAVLNSRFRILGGRDESSGEITISQTFLAQDSTSAAQAKRFVNVHTTVTSDQQSTWNDTIPMGRLETTKHNLSDDRLTKEQPIV